MYSDRINCYHPGWRSPPEVCVPAKSTVRSSVEEVSLHSDVVEHFLYYNMQSLTNKVYNEVHAQRSKFCFFGAFSQFCSVVFPLRLLVRVG